LEPEKYSPDDFKCGLSPPLKDLLGCRVLLYLPQDREPAAQAVRDAFPGCEDDRKTAARDKENGYRAYHMHVRLGLSASVGEGAFEDWVLHVPCEVQICTLTAHIWNELEHDIIYKTPDGQPDDAQREMLRSLNAELRLCEGTVERLMTRTAQRAAENQEVIASHEDLRYVLSTRWKAPIEGDLASLMQLLGGLMREVTPAAIDTVLKERAGVVRERELLHRMDKFGALGTVAEVMVAMAPGLGPDNIADLAPAIQPQTPFLKFAATLAGDLGGRQVMGKA
jgi:hypothetical protein